eukprot:861236-Pyramimonas_sp.AAC.1
MHRRYIGDASAMWRDPSTRSARTPSGRPLKERPAAHAAPLPRVAGGRAASSTGHIWAVRLR